MIEKEYETKETPTMGNLRYYQKSTSATYFLTSSFNGITSQTD